MRVGNPVHGKARLLFSKQANLQNGDERNLYEVELTIVTGDCGGMLFRATASLWHYYYFRICQDGTYAFYLYTHRWGQYHISRVFYLKYSYKLRSNKPDSRRRQQ